MRPRPEWISYTDESLRIVSEALYERAQRRMRPPDKRKQVHAGGKPKYLLQDFLVEDRPISPVEDHLTGSLAEPKATSLTLPFSCWQVCEP
jgi:hypothetical protein